MAVNFHQKTCLFIGILEKSGECYAVELHAQGGYASICLLSATHTWVGQRNFIAGL
jgi:hypothetical protein